MSERTHKWLTLFSKVPMHPVEYVGKFGCMASLLGYLHFNPIEDYYIGTLELPDR